MPKFKVIWTKEVYMHGELEVEAKDEAEAKRKAESLNGDERRALHSDDLQWVEGFRSYMVGQVKKA